MMNREQDILKELQELNSPLADISRAMPYEMPQGYFQQLPEKVYAEATRPGNGQELTGRAMPYDVPEDYFDKLPDNILAAAKAETAPPKRTSRSIWLNLRWAAAAVLILGLGIGTFKTMSPGRPGIEEQLNAIPDEAIFAYVNDHIDEFDADMIESHLDAESYADPSDVNDEVIEYYINTTPEL